MILDKLSEFCDATALTTGAIGTKNIGDIINLGVAKDLGQQPLFLVIQVSTAIVGTLSTVQFQLVSDSTSSISLTTQTIHHISMAIPEAILVAGYEQKFALPSELPAYEQFLAIQTVIGVANLSAGAINAFLTLDPHGNKSYPDAIN